MKERVVAVDGKVRKETLKTAVAVKNSFKNTAQAYSLEKCCIVSDSMPCTTPFARWGICRRLDIGLQHSGDGGDGKEGARGTIQTNRISNGV